LKLFKRNINPRSNYQVDRIIKKKLREKESFWLSLIPLMGFIIVIIFCETSEKNTKDYYHSQNTLFIISMLTMLYMVVKVRFHDTPIKSIIKFFKREKLSITESQNVIEGAVFMVALYGLLTVDMSFLHNYGFRIGTVVAFAFIKVLRVLFMKKQ